MSSSGGANRSFGPTPPPPTHLTSTSVPAFNSSLLLSPPNSRTFPFPGGGSYMESALLVPYDDDGGGARANATPTSKNEGAGAESERPPSVGVGMYQPFDQQPPLTNVDYGSRLSQVPPATGFEYNYSSPPPPSSVPANMPPVASSLNPYSVTSTPLYGDSFQQQQMQPSPYAVVADQTLPMSDTSAEVPTSAHYFGAYSSSTPITSTQAAPIASSTMPMSSVNPFSRSASANAARGSSAMSPAESIVGGSGMHWSPSSSSSPGSMGSEQPALIEYSRVHPHWFYCKEVEKKPVWFPFSLLDSYRLEEANNKADQQEVMIVATDGGRYDVYVQDRVRHAVYWEEEPTAVRRATWFYRLDGDRSFLPYEEHFSEKLEEEYEIAVTMNTWHRRLEFPEGETVVIHNPQVIVHYKPANIGEWDTATEGQMKPRVVRRGVDDGEIMDDGESTQIDHLVFVVHGIGAICDLKFRTLPEAVGDFRLIANGLLASHFRSHVESGRVGRVEFLPVSWHNFLHGDATGIDEKLKPITLRSIPKLRYFANDTILDVLFYTSPVYCQAIINQVSSEINRIHSLFLRRNPSFAGKVSLAGHSLGSVILFDLLAHQPSSSAFGDVTSGRTSTDARSPSPASSSSATAPAAAIAFDRSNSLSNSVVKQPATLEEALQQLDLDEYLDVFQKEKMDLNALAVCNEDDIKEMGIPLGPRKKILGLIHEIKDDCLGATRLATGNPGSPATTTTTTTTTTHQTDATVADIPPSGRRRKPSETMINYVVGMAGTGHPCVIYPRLDFQPTCFFAIGSPVAMFLTIRGHVTDWDNFRLPNCPAYYNIFHPFDPVAYRMEPLIDPSFASKPVLIPHHKGRKRMHLEIRESLSRVGADLKQKVVESLRSTWNTIHEFARAHRASTAQIEAEVDKVVEDEMRIRRKSSLIDDDLISTISSHDQRDEDLAVGQLNGGRRIDYVLQEKPIESFNEYLFALQSHTCYWESEDTVLLMLKEIYCSHEIHPSSQVPEPASKQPLQPNDRRHQDVFPRSTSYNNGFQRPSPSEDFDGSTPSGFEYSTAPYPAVPISQEISTTTTAAVGMDPTAPPSYVTRPPSSTGAPPPPLAGFVKQSAFRK